MVGAVRNIFILIFLIVFYSCNKEEENEFPYVEINSPYENQIISAVGTVLIEAFISDDKNIERVEMKLLDLESNLKSEVFILEVNSKEFDLAYNFELNEPELQGGYYYISVTAFDGQYKRSDYVKVLVNESQKELERIFVVTESSGMITTMVSDNNMEFSVFDSYFGDYAGSAVSSFPNIFAIAGRVNGDLKIFDTTTGAQTGIIPNASTSGMVYFNGLDFNEEQEKFFLLYGDGRIQVYDRNFAGLFLFEITSGYRPKYITAIDNELFVAANSITNNNHRLSIYHGNGILSSALTPPGEVVGVFKRNLSEVFVWINEGNSGSLKNLNRNSLLFGSPFQWQNNKVNDVIQLSSESFIVATENALYRYQNNSGNLIVLNNNLSLSKIKYDEVNSAIYGASGNILYILSYNGDIIYEVPFAGNVIDIELDFNR